MSKLLLDEHPLVILPQLAVAIGLNEAIFLQQLHYWLTKSKNAVKGRLWSYSSYEELQKQFPFFSVKTIQRVIKNLKDKELIFVDNFNQDRRNKTNWYSINYTNFESLMNDTNMEDACGQSDLMDEDNLTASHMDNLTSCIKNKSLTETNTETTTENKKILKKEFSFSLNQNTQYENLSIEYKDKLKAYAVTKDGAFNFDKFLDNHIAKGSRFKDWSRAYNTWLGNSQKFNKINPADYKRQIPHPTLKNVFAEYGVNNAYNGDTLEFIGSFETNETEELPATIQPKNNNASRVNEFISVLAQRVKA